MNLRKFVTVGALAATALLGLSACSGAANATPGADTGAADASGFAVNADTLVFGVVPDSVDTETNYQPLMDYIAQETGKTVEYHESTDYAALIEAAIAGKVDLFSTQTAVLDEVNRQAGSKLFEEKFVQQEFDVAIAMPRGEKALRAWVNGWVFAQLQNGRLNELFRRHHGHDLPADLRPAAGGGR